jgi:hypothetical protein
MGMGRRGYFTIGRWRGIPVKLHWSAPIGAYFWTGCNPSLVRILAFLSVTVVHELGHAVLVRRARAHVTEITVHAFGGECWWMGEATPIERAMIAFGGVWAQCLLAAAAFAWAALAPAQSALAVDLVDMFTRYNLYNAAFNLTPLRPLDGSEAWKLFPLLWKRARRSGRRRKNARDRRELKVIEGELQAVLRRAARKPEDE